MDRFGGVFRRMSRIGDDPKGGGRFDSIARRGSPFTLILTLSHQGRGDARCSSLVWPSPIEGVGMRARRSPLP